MLCAAGKNAECSKLGSIGCHPSSVPVVGASPGRCWRAALDCALPSTCSVRGDSAETAELAALPALTRRPGRRRRPWHVHPDSGDDRQTLSETASSGTLGLPVEIWTWWAIQHWQESFEQKVSGLVVWSIASRGNKDVSEVWERFRKFQCEC